MRHAIATGKEKEAKKKIPPKNRNAILSKRELHLAAMSGVTGDVILLKIISGVIISIGTSPLMGETWHAHDGRDQKSLPAAQNLILIKNQGVRSFRSNFKGNLSRLMETCFAVSIICPQVFT